MRSKALEKANIRSRLTINGGSVLDLKMVTRMTLKSVITIELGGEDEHFEHGH